MLQQTFLHVVRKLHTLREPRTLPAWLYAVARNAALAHRRSAAGRVERTSTTPSTSRELSGADDDGDDFDAGDAEAVHAALGELSVPHREALTLLFLQDLSVDEIAQVIGVSPGTVKSRVHYAKRAMRRSSSEQGVRTWLTLPRDFGERLVAREEVDPMRLEQLREQVAAVLELQALAADARRPTRSSGRRLLGSSCVAFVPTRGRPLGRPAVPWRAPSTVVGLGGLAADGHDLSRGRAAGRATSAAATARCSSALPAHGPRLRHGAPPHRLGDAATGRSVFGGTALLVFGGAAFVLHVLEQYHLATKRKLLELELRMAELAERLDRPRRTAGERCVRAGRAAG